MTITNFQSAVLVARQITPTPAFVATSATSLLIGTGVKTFTTQSGTAFRAGQYVRLISAANAANYMEGNINSYSGTTMVVNVLAIGPTASGTFADWVIGIAGSPGVGDLLSSANLSDVANVSTARINLGVREPLAASRTYFVRTDGNDAAGHTGLVNSSGDAFLTIQKAIDTALENLDPRGQLIAINVADGTYTGANTISVEQNGIPVLITITGNTGTPANVFINTTGNCFSIVGRTSVALAGMKLASSTGDGIFTDHFAAVSYSAMDFGACSVAHISIDGFSNVLCAGDYSITGVAGAHIHMPAPGVFLSGAHTCTIVGTLTGGAFFIGTRASGAYAYLANMTFVNGVGWNASRYVAHYGSVIDCEGKGKDFLPGTSPGVSNDGGQYIGLTPVVGLGRLLNQIAVGASVTLDFRRGLVWFDDANAASALVSYAGSTGTPVPTIVWQSVSGSFATGADPGAGSNKWWVQSGGIVTNRFGALNSLNYAIVTSDG